MAVVQTCSWCHEVVDITAGPTLCHLCGHRADVARVNCDCHQCRLYPFATAEAEVDTPIMLDIGGEG